MPDIPFPINIDLLHPSYAQLELSDIVYICEGDGVLEGDSAPVFPSQFGLWWQFTTVPPGIGLTWGGIIHYAIRMVQWQLIHTIGGIELCTELLDADYDRVVWRWDVSKPTRIAYSVCPGVVLQARKVIARQPPTLETTPPRTVPVSRSRRLRDTGRSRGSQVPG
jgi:hypothetical protein